MRSFRAAVEGRYPGALNATVKGHCMTISVEPQPWGLLVRHDDTANPDFWLETLIPWSAVEHMLDLKPTN